MLKQNPSDSASQAEKALLLIVLFALLVLGNVDRAFGRSGFSAYDEESHLNLLQAWREGDPLYWRFGNGSIFRAFSSLLIGAFGPQEALLYLPAQVGLALEALLLFLWLRPRLGERAAVWACLADLVCSATFARGRSMLSPAWLPMAFLAHAVALDHLRARWQHALWAFSALLWAFDYEGWLGALVWLLPAWMLAHGRGSGAGGRWAAAALGAAAGACLVASQDLELGKYLVERAAISAPRSGLAEQIWANLKALLGGGHRMAFSGASQHPWPPPWIWPLVLLGTGIVWRRFKGGFALLAVGALPLGAMLSAAEPHRLSLALLAMAAMAGAAAASLWRQRWGPAFLFALLGLGAFTEARAWHGASEEDGMLAYGRSRDLSAAAQWMEEQQPEEGWELFDGIGPYHDGCFRLMLDQRRVDRRGRRPIALVHADYGPALIGLRGRWVAFNHSGQLPLLLYLPTPDEAPRLRSIHQDLKAFQHYALRATGQSLREYALTRLHQRDLSDPWTRTVYWEAWMQANLRLNELDPADLNAAIREPLVSGWAFDAGAEGLKEAMPERAALLHRRAEMADPRRKDLRFRHVRL